MTEKRFTVIDMEEPRGQSVAEKGIPCTARHCCTRLNRLTEENEHLKAEVYILQDDILNKRVRNLREDNEQLKQQINKLEAQLHCPFDSICIKCNNEYLVQKGEYYVSRCKKGHEQCSKTDVRYCDDFELKGDDGND